MTALGRVQAIGRQLLTVADRVAVVCWPTLAEDNAARAFASGFYDRVHKMLQQARPRRPHACSHECSA